MSSFQDQILRLSPVQREFLANKIGIINKTRKGDDQRHSLACYINLKSGSKVNAKEIQRFLAAKLPEHMIPQHISFLPAFPVTANGKIDRQSLAQRSVPVARTGPQRKAQTGIEECLIEIWTDVLQVRGIGTSDNFFELGGDSILAIQVVSRALQKGYHLTPRQLFQYPSIVQLARQVQPLEPHPATASQQVKPGHEVVEGVIPLTPIQAWFFGRDLADKHHFNQAFFFSLSRQLNTEKLGKVLRVLIKHHDALRLRFFQTDNGWLQVNLGADNLNQDSLPLTDYDLSAMTEPEQEQELIDITRQLQHSLDLGNGPLIRMAHFILGSEQPDRLLIIIHHLAIDGVSWRILHEDIQTAYSQLEQGNSIQLPPKTNSYKQWAEEVRAYAGSGSLDKEVDYWAGLPYGKVADLPVDSPPETNVEEDVESVSCSFGAATTSTLLQEVPSVYNTQVTEVLLTALSLAFYRWKKLPAVLVEPEHHGREKLATELDLSRTVGWFTTAYPVVLLNDQPDDLSEMIKSTKEQLRHIPNNGIGYWLLRYGHSGKKVKQELMQLRQSQVSFNYLGQLDKTDTTNAILEFSGRIPVQAYSPSTTRPYLLEIYSYILGKQLKITWRYNKTIHQRSTIETLCGHFEGALRDIIAHCVASANVGYTPSDFPNAQLDQDELDDLLDELS